MRMIWFVSLVFIFTVIASDSAAQVHEFDLPNGMHVIVNSVLEAEDVGVETFHEVGFVDEPESMVQSRICWSTSSVMRRVPDSRPRRRWPG